VQLPQWVYEGDGSGVKTCNACKKDTRSGPNENVARSQGKGLRKGRGREGVRLVEEIEGVSEDKHIKFGSFRLGGMRMGKRWSAQKVDTGTKKGEARGGVQNRQTRSSSEGKGLTRKGRPTKFKIHTDRREGLMRNTDKAEAKSGKAVK